MIARAVSLLRSCWDDVHVLQFLGPLFLLLTFMMAPADNTEMLFAAIVGAFFCIRGGARGCIYALILLVLVAIAKHAWLFGSHLHQLGTEASIAAALIVTTLGFQLNAYDRKTQSDLLSTHAQTIANLEEELAEHREESAKAQTIWLEKLHALTQSVEESQSESAALQVLNEVLRQTAAKAAVECEQLQREERAAQARVGDLLQEIDALQRELHRIANEHAVVQENTRLHKELNVLRMAKAQAELSCDERCQEIERLSQELTSTRAELEMAEAHVEKVMEQAHSSDSNSHEEIVALREERAFLTERIAVLQQELEAKPAIIVEPPAGPNQVEQLYRQLRVQFEEKGEQLHKARAEFFRVDTELQTLRREAEARALESEEMPVVAREAIEALEEERRSLSEDNKLLEELVSHLMGEPLKTSQRAMNVRAEQGELF